MARKPIVLLLALAAAGCGGHGARHPAPHLAPRPDPVVAAILGASGRLETSLRGNGAISTIVADGQGGWYVTGRFTRLSGVDAPGLAHVRATGAVDRGWRGRPPAKTSTLLAAWGTTVYFSRVIDDSDRFTLSAVNARTGDALSRVLPGVGSPAATDGRHIYVANLLPTSHCIGAFGPTGLRTLYAFQLAMPPESACVNALAIWGSRLYAAGSMVVAGETAPVARFDLNNGRLDSGWTARPLACATCYGLAYAVAVAPGRVFVSPGTDREPVDALSGATGEVLTAWRPPGLHPSVPLSQLAVAGGLLFAVGDLGPGPVRTDHGLIALAVRTGAARPTWHPPAGARAIAVAASGGRVLVSLGPSS